MSNLHKTRKAAKRIKAKRKNIKSRRQGYGSRPSETVEYRPNEIVVFIKSHYYGIHPGDLGTIEGPYKIGWAVRISKVWEGTKTQSTRTIYASSTDIKRV